MLVLPPTTFKSDTERLYIYLTFNKLHSRTSLNLGNSHFPFTYNEGEKTKFLVFLLKLF